MLLTGYLLLKLLSIVSNDSMSFSRWFIGILYTFWRQAPCWLYVSRQKLWHVTYRESFVPTISTPHLLPPLTPSFILGSMSLWLNNNNNNNNNKTTMWELWVKFYSGQNEDYSLGDSLSDTSEGLIWGHRAGRSAHMWFWSRGTHAIKHTFW